MSTRVSRRTTTSRHQKNYSRSTTRTSIPVTWLQRGRDFQIKAYDSLKEILNENIHTDQQGRRYLALENFAILFEPALKINLRSLIEDYAKRILLILRIDHLPESSDAYYPFPEDKFFRLDLTDLNYTTLA